MPTSEAKPREEIDMGIQNGSKVTMHYKLTVDGKTVDTSEGKDPLQYVHGQGEIIPGLEKELEGLDKGEKKQVTITPEAAYGHHDPAAIQRVPRSAFAQADNLKVGSTVRGQAGDQIFTAVVKEITTDEITLDMNHPLAGKTLNFDIEVVEVE